MKVIAVRGTRCPKEDNPRTYITDDIAVDVPETAYYKRLIADGSLQLVSVNSVSEQTQKTDTDTEKRGGKE